MGVDRKSMQLVKGVLVLVVVVVVLDLFKENTPRVWDGW